MFVELLVAVFVGGALFVVFMPIIFFIWSLVNKGPEGAFQDYMEYKTTQAILNNADQSNWKK